MRGDNSAGQTADYSTVGATTNEWTLISTNVKAASTGAFHSMAVLNDGSLYTWGSNSNGVLGIGTADSGTSNLQRVGTAKDWIQVNTGVLNAYGIKKDGTLWAWGSGTYGALGNGSTSSSYLLVRVDNPPRQPYKDTLSKA